MPSSQARWTRFTLSLILLPHRSKLTVHYIYYPVLVYTHKQKFSSFWNCSKVERSSETSTWTSVQAEHHRILQEGMFSLIYCKQICLHRDPWDLTPQFPRLMRYPLGHKTAIYKIWYHVFVLCLCRNKLLCWQRWTDWSTFINKHSRENRESKQSSNIKSQGWESTKQK